MGRTRAVHVPMAKMEVPALLAMIASATDQGFAVPQQTIVDATSKKQAAWLTDSGLVSYTLGIYGASFTITEAGRKEIATHAER